MEQGEHNWSLIIKITIAVVVVYYLLAPNVIFPLHLGLAYFHNRTI